MMPSARASRTASTATPAIRPVLLELDDEDTAAADEVDEPAPAADALEAPLVAELDPLTLLVAVAEVDATGSDGGVTCWPLVCILLLLLLVVILSLGEDGVADAELGPEEAPERGTVMYSVENVMRPSGSAIWVTEVMTVTDIVAAAAAAAAAVKLTAAHEMEEACRWTEGRKGVHGPEVC